MRSTTTTRATLMLMGFAAVAEPLNANQMRSAPIKRLAHHPVPKLMDEAIVPGVQIAGIENGRIRVQSFGVADVGSGRRVTQKPFLRPHPSENRSSHTRY